MAEESNGGLVFGIRLDNSQLQKDIENAQKMFDSLGKNNGEGIKLGNLFDSSDNAAKELSSKYSKSLQDLYVAAGNAGAKVRDESAQTVSSVSSDLDKLNSGFNSITSLAGKMFMGVSAMEIAGKMFETRSYFQDAESSMKVFLGSAAKGTQFINELKDYAYYNMFEFSDLVGASKQLIAYGTDAKNVTDVLDKLSNVATGTGASLNDMVGMYNKAKSIGKVDSQGLESWAARGVMVKDTLREMGEVVGSTGVTFEQLNMVLDKVTSEGGMFHGLMLEQMDNLSASMGQLQDNLTSMWNEMGEASEGAMKGAIDLAGLLVENYQEIGSVLLDVAKVYGAYKVVEMSGIQGIIETAKEEAKLVETFKQHGEEIQNLLSPEQAQELALQGLKEDTLEYAKAVSEKIKGEKESAELLLETTNKELAASESRQSQLSELMKATDIEIEQAKLSGDTKKLEALETGKLALADEMSANAKRVADLQGKKQIVTIQATMSAKKAETLATMQNTVVTQKNTVVTNLLTKAKGALGAATEKVGKMLNTTVLANPYALIAAGVVALGVALYKLLSMKNAYEKAQDTLNEANAAWVESSEKEILTLNRLTRTIRDNKEGTKEYEAARATLEAKYPDYFRNLDTEVTKTELLTTKYEELRDAIEAKHKSEAYESAIETNNSNIATRIKELTAEFTEKMNDAGIESWSIEGMDIADAFTKSLEEGLSDSEIVEKFGDIGKKVLEIKNDSEWDWSDLFYISPAAPAKLMKSMYDASGATSALEFVTGKCLNLFKTGEDSVGTFNSALEGSIAAFQEEKKQLEEVNEKMQEYVDIQNGLDIDAFGFNVAAIEQFNKQATAANDQLAGISMGEYQMLGFTKEFKAKVRQMQKERNENQRLLEKAKRDILGDDYNTQKQKYNKQINLYKSFASEYAKLEIKRQNDLEKLEQSRDKKGANRAVIDVQMSDVNKKADDDLKLLMAKYYNVSGKTAEEVKNVFKNALTLPIDEAQNRLLEVTTRIEKIKNAAADGDNIATREEQAKLAAEQAALQQNIAKSQEKNLYDEKQKRYEDYYNELIRIANEKEGKIADLQRRKQFGELDEEQYKKAEENLDNFYEAQANIIRKNAGMTDEEAWSATMGTIGSATQQGINELRNNLEDLKNQMDYLEGELGNGIDVREKLDEVREKYNETLAEMELMTQDSVNGIQGVWSKLSAAQKELANLEVRKAKGEDVAKEIALTTAKITQYNNQLQNLGMTQEEITEKTDKLTAEEIALLDAMTNQAKWKKVTKYYDAAKSGLTSIIDSCEGLSDTTKDVLNGMIEMGDILMSTVDQLMQNAVNSAQAIKTAGIASAEAVKTAEKGSAILAIIGAAIQAVMAIVKIFNKHGKTARAQANIEAIEGQVKELDRAYDKLGKEIDDAYSTDATPLIRQQDKLLAQKEALVKQQIAEEKSKKKKKQDADQIKEWEQELEDIAEARGNMEQNWVEKLIGKDYKGVLEDFSGSVMDAMDDAETSVEDAVKNIGKSIKKGAIQQQLNAKLQPTTEEYARTLAKAMEDGVLDASETSVLEGLEKNIATISENYLGQFNDLWAQAEEESRNAVTGGITNMSQDTAEEMNGRLTQIQSHTFSISENVAEMRNFAQQQLLQLTQINANTLAALGKQDKIAAMLDDISIRGVKLKA